MGILKAIQAIFDSSSSEQFGFYTGPYITPASNNIVASIKSQLVTIQSFIQTTINVSSNSDARRNNLNTLKELICTLQKTIKDNKVDSSKIAFGNNSTVRKTLSDLISKYGSACGSVEYFANNCSGGSWFYEIFHTIIALFALYLSFQCNGGFDLGAFLLACICPYIYIPYVLFTHSDRCGLQWVQKILGGVSRPPSY